MEIVFTPEAQRDREYWKKSGNVSVQNRITALLKDMQQHPYMGIGKPERLKYNLTGNWSRRITGEHRLVYFVENEIITIISCRFHY
ncbi:Txe/YoeB family addiction module toxin [Bacteroidia bacterium]|nr:Txe/YoeB family addiction module toxin [Bacteroidia bacterium]